MVAARVDVVELSVSLVGWDLYRPAAMTSSEEMSG
jgi:hypothetical protein